MPKEKKETSSPKQQNEKVVTGKKVESKNYDKTSIAQEPGECYSKPPTPKHDQQKLLFKPPVKVSPLIKLFRYTFLFCGIIYGFSKHSNYAIKEANLRETTKEQKQLRDAQIAAEKRKLGLEMEKAIEDYLNADSATKNAAVQVGTPGKNRKTADSAEC